MRTFTEWLVIREEVNASDKCSRCGASGENKKGMPGVSSKIEGKTYCDTCARQIRREENK